jgi:hypothetical protein
VNTFGDRELSEVCRSVLIDVLTVLGSYLDRLVIVGGWVPELALPEQGHIGSLDVDLALDARRIPTTAYDTIRQKLLDAGYRTTNVAGRFERDVSRGADVLTVRLDLIAGEYTDSSRDTTHQQIQEIFVWKSRGADLAFLSSVEVQVSGVLPEGGRNSVKARIPTIPVFICMKAIALHERKKPKDAYDIYFCVENYGGGSAALARDFTPLMDNGLVREGLRKLRAKFSSPQDIGPVWAAQFYQSQGEQEFRQLDAFERVTAFLDSLHVEPWKE